MCCDSGLPLSDKRKIDASRVAFGIPKDEKIFLISSGNIMGGFTRVKELILSYRK